MGTAVAELLEYLTPSERLELDTHLIALNGVGTLKDFVTRTNKRYVWWRHCQILSDTLQKVADGEINRLMVFMPPRHGKSQIVSRHFPAYYLRKHPDRWVGLASYEATLAQDFSRSCRDAFTMDGGKLRGDSKAVDLWQTTSGGGMWAAGVGGPLTGKGGHLLLIDDPIKNDEEAASETIRAKHKSWFDSTFSTRLEPQGAIVVVQTRWNEDDLSGYLLAKEEMEPEGWTILNFPATYEEDALAFPSSCTLLPDWRTQGEPLCPERYDSETLRKIMKRVGSYFWSALYQQRPSPAEGGTFKRAWWKYYTELPLEMDFVCQSWDMAFKDTDGSDYVVGTVWGVRGPNAYLLDLVRDRMDFPSTIQAVKRLTAKWPKAHVTLIEDAANGTAVIQSLKQKLPGIIAVKPIGGKESRAAAIAPLVESGNVFLPESASWVNDFVEECAGFPNGNHDDQVDSMTQALAKIAPMMRARALRPVLEKHEDKATPYDYERKRFVRRVDAEEELIGRGRKSLTQPYRVPRPRAVR